MNACVDAHRELYNAALQERRDGWAHSQARITYSSQAAQLTDMRLASGRTAVSSRPYAGLTRHSTGFFVG